MKRIHSKHIIPLCTAVVASVFIYLGVGQFGFWQNGRGPMPGFVPTIIASILLLISLLAFIQAFREQPPAYPAENFMAVLGGAALIGMTMLIGMIPSIAVYVVLWLKVYEKSTWKQTLTVLAVIMAIVLGVFVAWLGVPFPNGMIFDAILG